MSETGHIIAVNVVPLGSALTADTSVGASSLTVDDAADFPEGGGTVIVGGSEVVDYTDADPDSGTLTLADTTSEAWLEGDSVFVFDSDRASAAAETSALVRLDGETGDADALDALVPSRFLPFLVEGIREPDGEEAVVVDWVDGRLTVVDLPDRATNSITVVDDAGDVTAAVSRSGDATFRDIDFTGDFRADPANVILDGTSLADVLAGFPRGLLAYGRCDPAVTLIGPDDEYGIMEFSFTTPDDASTRAYRLTLATGFDAVATTNDDPGTMQVSVRWESAAAGTTPTEPSTSSDLLAVVRFATSDSRTTRAMIAEGVALADATSYRVLVTMRARYGLDSSDTYRDTEAWVEDLGPAVPNTAVANDGGGALLSGGSDSGSGGSGGTKQYVKTFNATWSRSYGGDGSLRSSDSTSYQGHYSSAWGNQKSAIGFSSSNIQAAVAGSTIDKVEVYLYFSHWYFNSGGTAVIGYHGEGSAPSTWGGLSNKSTDEVRSTGWPKPGGRWVDITSMSKNSWKDGTIKGILVGPGPSNSDTFYGSFKGNSQSNEPKLRFTYTK